MLHVNLEFHDNEDVTLRFSRSSQLDINGNEMEPRGVSPVASSRADSLKEIR